MSPPSRIQPASGFAGSIPSCFPKMILRLLCGVVNPKRAETRSTNQTVVAARSGIPSRISARVCTEFVSEDTVVELDRSLKLYELRFFLTGEGS